MEDWREKAIECLKQSSDPEMANAIKALQEGKGYLTSTTPVRIVFYEDMPK